MLRIVEKPTSDPVSLAEAKAQLRIPSGSTTNDIIVQGLIPAATRFVQSLVQRVFVPQVLEWVLPAWRHELCIPIAPVAKDGINSIKYVDWSTETERTLDPSLYVVQPKGASVRIFPKFGTAWPLVFSFASEPIVVNFDAGYEDPTDLPANVKAAILLEIRHLYSLGEVNPALVRDSVMGIGEKQFRLTPDTAGLIPDAVRNLVLSEVW
jgi:uncharacterized phiE125 gp8 family phage protein